MADKILNTRILLKIDTLENWQKSTLPLKKGELAIATVAATAGTGLTEPVCMIKIGEDGVKTFKDLSWNFYAKASDVVAAAKSEDSLRTFVNGVIADAGIATNEAMEALAGRVTTVEGDLNTASTGLKARMTAVETAMTDLVGDTKVATQISTAIEALKLGETYDAKGAAAAAESAAKGHADSLNTAMNTRVEALEAIDHDHSNKAELDKIADGDKAKWDTMEQNAKDYADDLDEAMDARVLVLEGKFGDGEGNVESQIAAAVNAEKEAREGADAGLQEQITANADAIKALDELVGDENVAEAIEAAVAAEAEIARAAEKANADAIVVLNGNAETAGSVDYKIAQKFATLMENPDEAMNSIQELVDWTTEHAADALEMSNQVTANKNALETLNGGATVAGSVDKKIADAIAAENLSQYATDTDLSGVSGRLAIVEGDYLKAADKTELQGKIDLKAAQADLNTANAAIEALEKQVGDKDVSVQIEEAIEALKIGDYAKAADLTAAIGRIAQNETDISGLKGRMDTAEGEIDALQEEIVKKANDADLKAVAKSGLIDDLSIGEGTVLIFDCGDSTGV